MEPNKEDKSQNIPSKTDIFFISNEIKGQGLDSSLDQNTLTCETDWFEQIDNSDYSDIDNIFDQGEGANTHEQYGDIEWECNHEDAESFAQSEHAYADDQKRTPDYEETGLNSQMRLVDEEVDISQPFNTNPRLEGEGTNENDDGQEFQKSDTTSPVQPFVEEEDDEEEVGDVVENYNRWDEIDLHSDEERSLPSPPPSNSGDSSGSQIEYKTTVISVFFDILYYLGFSTQKADGTNPGERKHYVPFVAFAMIAMLEAFMLIKNHLVYEDKHDNILLYFLTLGYLILAIIHRLYFAYLVSVKGRTFATIIKSAKEIGRCFPKLKIIPLVVLPLLLSVISALFQTVLETITVLKVNGVWDVDDFILQRSFQLALTLYWWGGEGFEIKKAYIQNEFGNNITPITVTLGLLDVIFTIIGTVFYTLPVDASLVFAYTVYDMSDRLKKELDESPPILTTDICNRLWKQYKRIRDFSKTLNECLWLFFPLLDFNNLLFCAYFSFDNIIMGQHTVLIFPGIILITKMILFYVLAAKASSVNIKFKQWVVTAFRSTHTLIEENLEPVATASILEEIKLDPIGIGSNIFYIDESFLWKIPGAIGTFFIFFSESAEDLLHNRV